MTRIGARLAGVLALAATLSAAPAVGAAELVMFWREGCPYCERFDREIAPIYEHTDESRIAPLRRVDIHRPIPPDLNFIAMERLTPVFVLVERGREVGRIRGYPGEDNFWGLLAGLIDKLRPAVGAAVD
jgi:thiol-disulfide isomerase/thioredoxin